LQYIDFASNCNAEVAILIKEPSLDKYQLQANYIDALHEADVVVYGLPYDGKKASAKCRKAFIAEELMPELKDQQPKVVLVADTDYYKTLMKVTNTKGLMGVDSTLLL